MWNRHIRRVAFWLGCVAIGCALLPASSRAGLKREIATSVRLAPVRGLALTKEVDVMPISVRDTAFELVLGQGATGDTYNAAGLVQTAGDAFFVDDLPDNHTFGTGEESAGLSLLASVDMRIVGVDLGPGVPGTNRIEVHYFTADGSDIVPRGTLAPDGSFFEAWRFDVGAGAVDPDQINWTPNPGFTVVDSGLCAFNDGVSLGCFALNSDDSSSDGVAGVGLLGFDPPDDIAGFGLDELVMFWEIQLNPSCGDGNQDAGEECDDGNLVDGDGCSATCALEGLIGDTNGDGDVDLLDMAIILNNMTGPIVP